MKKTNPEPERETASQAKPRTTGRQEPLESNNQRGAFASLHQSAGNSAMQRLVEAGRIQPRLEVSRPSDPAEREAEEAARKVMEMSDSEAVKTLEDDEQDRKLGLSSSLRGQRAGTGSESPTVSNEVERRIRSKIGGGQPMSTPERAYFEPRFGQDFDDVRLHDDNKSDQLARSVGAEAFTIGNDIFFKSGAYHPESTEGRRLLAHELTHVVQQRDQSTVSRQGWEVGAAVITAVAAVIGVGFSISKTAGTSDVTPQFSKNVDKAALSSVEIEDGQLPAEEAQLAKQHASTVTNSFSVWIDEENDRNLGAEFTYTYHIANVVKGNGQRFWYFEMESITMDRVYDGVGWGGNVIVSAVDIHNPGIAEMDQTMGLVITIRSESSVGGGYTQYRGTYGIAPPHGLFEPLNTHDVMFHG